MPRLTLAQARRMQLAAQGLLQPARRTARPGDVTAVIEQMRLLQIDTIHVVARSPYLVLYSRLGSYEPTWLDEALAQARLAECWAHEACFVPAADYPLHQAWREQRTGHWSYRQAQRERSERRVEMDAILQQVRMAGSVRSTDFSREERAVSGWWSWKPEKRWLEAWFALGELMVDRRERFQRVYAPAESVRARLDPPFDPRLAALDATALRRRFVLDSVRALGVTTARWIADYYRLKPVVSDDELAPLLVSGELIEVSVTGWPTPGYVHRDHAATLAQAASGRLRATHTTVLSPFDPLVWDRVRLRAMFDFDYSIESYTPAAKRRYGYYVLPILHRGELVGRLDAKAHRAEGLFEVKTLYLEPGIVPTPRLLAEVAEAIAATARWHGTPRVQLTRSKPAGLAAALRTHWRSQARAV